MVAVLIVLFFFYFLIFFLVILLTVFLETRGYGLRRSIVRTQLLMMAMKLRENDEVEEIFMYVSCTNNKKWLKKNYGSIVLVR